MKLTSMMRVWLTRSLKPFIFTNEYSKELEIADIEQLGLYVHIPFCRRLCSFCPYCKVIYDENQAKCYKSALLKEIDIVGATMSKPKQVTSLYFGGGTPALMVDDIGEIIQGIKKYFIISDGIGVELHPDDINPMTLKKLKDAGVTMISIGVQSFNENCLSAIGRKPTDYNYIFKTIQDSNFETIDIDLIFAIPNQTEKTLEEDIATAFSNGGTQISTYPFIDFTFANNTHKPLSEVKKKKMLRSITSYCERNGYDRTSVWTFAKKNTGKYSSITRDNFIGFGVSATTLLKSQFKINTFSIDEYIKRVEEGKLPTSLTLDFSLRQRAVYYLFWSCYSMKIDTEKFKKFFGVSLNKLFGLEILICRILGFIKKQGKEIYVTNRGAYYYHYIEQAYTTAYIDKMWNVSRKIAFPEQIILK
ncbi:MAG: radical SAM protein [Clostridium sp.]|uniref:coproporphyrinogen-III oxidase family protein n=1 Tax=Clostridium sp. TaxID=1506 RepID=UPI003027BE5C